MAISMKILYGITKGNFGGAQRYVFDLATEATKLGNKVSVLVGQGGLLKEKLEKEKIEVIELSTLARDISILSDIKSFFEIYKILRRAKPDVFHTNSSKMGGIGGLSARLAGVKKIVFTSHGWAFNEKRPWYERLAIRVLYWKIILLSHTTICVSENTKNQIQLLPFISNKLRVIRNGIKPFSLLPSAPREMLIVGALGELHHIKGFDILLHAWAKFIKHHGAKLVICGTGEERKHLKDLVEELGVSALVEFRGYVDDARRELLNFDIFVMPSRSENLPYALLEAGVAGLPVIASRVGGIPEIIESGINGILVEKENVEALFSSLMLLAGDKELRERLGERLHERVLEEFSLDKMVSDTIDTYE